MLKAYLLLTTLTLAFFPFHLPNINHPVLTPSMEADEQICTPPNESFFHDEKENLIPFGKEVGKVIKEKKLRKGGYRINTIVIDPGHGGYDSGCRGSQSLEKSIALAISKKLAREIEYSFPNVKVIMTRDKDYFVPLYKRAAIANKNKADLFLSIHCNAMSNAGFVKGTETYVLGLHKAEANLNVAKRENASILLEDNYKENYDFDLNSPEGHIMLSMYQNASLEQSILFGQKVEEKMTSNAQRHSRGVKQAGFQVLYQTTMPSVLVETGFLTNGMEENFLTTNQGQQRIAIAIFEAFRDYKYEVEGRVGDYVAVAPVREKTTRPTSKVKKEEFKINATDKASEPQQKVVFDEPFRSLPSFKKPPSNAASRIQFRVQLAASPKPMNINRGKWKNMDYLVEVIREGGFFKYQARNFSSFDEAEDAKQILRQHGFNDAFVVAYRDGQRMKMSRAKAELGLE